MSERKILLQQAFEDIDAFKRLMQPCFASVLQDLNISGAQAHVLLILRDGQPISLKSLAAKMWLTPGAITQLVDGLARAGHLIRARDVKDRRVIYIRPSGSGTALIKKLAKHRSELIADMMSGLDDTELAQLAAIQRKMVQRLAEIVKQNATKKERT